MFKLLLVRVISGTITYVNWISYWFLYMPKKLRNWFEKSMARLFILDIALTVGGAVIFSALSASLIAVIAATTLGLLGTITAIGIRGCCY